MQEKNIGNKIWTAVVGTKNTLQVCPICFGKKEVTLILGNGEGIKTECEYCAPGFESSKGFVEEYIKIAEVKEVIITGKETIESNDGKHFEYMAGRHSITNNMFDSKEDAEKHIKEIINKEDEHRKLMNAEKIRKNQTHYSWSIGYHRKRLKDAQREISYHSSKIIELNNSI